MWPSFRQAILNTVENIQTLHQPYARISRNVGIAAAIIGTILGIITFISITYLIDGMEMLEENDALALSPFNEGVSISALFIIISSSLLAIHLYKGSVPVDGLTFTQGIPAPAKRMLYAGTIIILVFFSIIILFELAAIVGPYTASERSIKGALAFKWSEALISNLSQVATAVIAILIYIKGTGNTYSSSNKSAFITAVIMLFFWIRILQIIIYLVNSVISLPLGALFPLASLTTLLSCGVTIIVYIFGMIPAAAMAASVIQPENDIQFEGETETQL